MYGFRKPMTQECELLVRPTGTDLQIVIKDKKRREFKKASVYQIVVCPDRLGVRAARSKQGISGAFLIYIFKEISGTV